MLGLLCPAAMITKVATMDSLHVENDCEEFLAALLSTRFNVVHLMLCIQLQHCACSAKSKCDTISCSGNTAACARCTTLTILVSYVQPWVFPAAISGICGSMNPSMLLVVLRNMYASTCRNCSTPAVSHCHTCTPVLWCNQCKGYAP
jgi:hypothetical protein